MNFVHIAYVPGELSYREGMARLQSNNSITKQATHMQKHLGEHKYVQMLLC